ncbi:unnamed protein product [Cylicocyclus nassatus]|uniref:Uncharacterized protein n=1 Tax=Cylicocyclus nassatus TaxID=53992 RepID=A0AA36DTH9_CYLNA|nr:unnamed protein product [Cylicocyclus nassatus]
MLVALVPLLLACLPVIDGNSFWSEQRAKRGIESLLENYTFTIRDDYVDENITAYFEFELRYNAAKNALRKNLGYTDAMKTNRLINEELDKLKKSKNETKKSKEPISSEVVLKGRQSIFMPCFTPHTNYVQSCDSAGCTGAKAFARTVCSEFLTCMRKTHTSYWMCKPKICSKFKKMPKHPRCYDYLFKCD